MSDLTTRALAMVEKTPLKGEEYDMIQELAERVVELERRAALAIELRNAGMPGFVEDALNGEDVRTNRLVRECLDNIKKLDDIQQ